ncbi:putative RNA helicase [Helianthus anomalus]
MVGCSDEILMIILMIQTGNIFYRPREKQAQADQKRAKFFQAEGDQLTLLAAVEGGCLWCRWWLMVGKQREMWGGG